MHNILLVEDEKLIAETVIEYLKREGYAVFYAPDINEAMKLVSNQIDIVVLDLMLPDGNGEDFCEYVVSNYSLAVIILTSKKAEQSKINCFALGADDYLTKPFSPRELVARVKAVLKRVKPTSNIIEMKSGISIDIDDKSADKNGAALELTPNEYNILLCLVNNVNKTVSREMLIENIKSSDSYDRTIDVHIRHLRMKIEADPQNPFLITTIYGNGYKLNDERK